MMHVVTTGFYPFHRDILVPKSGHLVTPPAHCRCAPWDSAGAAPTSKKAGARSDRKWRVQLPLCQGICLITLAPFRTGVYHQHTSRSVVLVINNSVFSNFVLSGEMRCKKISFGRNSNCHASALSAGRLVVLSRFLAPPDRYFHRFRLLQE